MKAIIFDTETTGFKNAQIIEAAWLEVESPYKLGDDDVQSDYNERFKPTIPIEFGAMATHHILPEFLEGKRPHSEFSLPCDLEYMIGHNVDFDWNMSGSPKEVKRICSLALSRKYFPELESHTQSAMVYYFCRDDLAIARLKVKDAHSALCDVYNCMFILNCLVKHVEQTLGIEILEWESLWLLSEDARIPDFITFGKYKGWLVSEVPLSYRQWYTKQTDTDPYVLAAFKKHC